MIKRISLAIGLLFICQTAFAGMSGSIGPAEYRFKRNTGSSANKVGTQRRYSGCTFLAQYDDDLTADGSIGSPTATPESARDSDHPKTYFDANGVMQKTEVADTGVINHGYYDTTGFHLFTHAGYYPESASTNLIVRTDGTASGAGLWTGWAVGGTKTGIPVNSQVSVDGVLINLSDANAQRIQYTGVVGDAPAKTINFTSSNTGAASVVQDDVITLSFWARSQTGNIGIINIGSEFNVYNNVPAYISTYSHANFLPSLTTSWRKFRFTSTIIDATADRVNVRINVTGIDDTDLVDIEFYGFQVEKSPHATSFIPTTTAALTRNAETNKYETLGNRTAAVESMVIKLAPEYADSTIAVSAFATSSDTDDRRLWFFTGNDVLVRANNDQTDCAILDLINDSWTANTEMTLGYAIQHSSPYIAGYYNGVADGTNETVDDFTTPAWGTYFHVGNKNDGTEQLNGTIFSIAFFDRVKAAIDFADLYNPDIDWKRSGFFN